MVKNHNSPLEIFGECGMIITVISTRTFRVLTEPGIFKEALIYEYQTIGRQGCR